ncbi:MAG: hypothetical protein IKP36_11660 [Bacteroidaceae bacterium]|nr:hypothetical protein [Bacteroidaceae bacterium]
MKKVYLILAATVGMTITSCTTNDFIGEVATTPEEVVNDGSIRFGGGFKAITRADQFGADAASLLGNQFIVTGIKATNGSPDVTSPVFNSYTVKWTKNTAGTTESNTSDWEYVYTAPYSAVTTVATQSIKYWDYSQNYYDFAAYSVGGNTLEKLPDTPSDPSANTVQGTAITYPTGYQLKGSKDDLAECYITDMTKVTGPAGFGGEVTLSFRNLATKVRMAIYETVPGYSVKNVKFYTADQNPVISVYASSDNATLIGSAFYTGGLYTVTFPTTGSANSSETDFNKAHVTMTTPTATNTYGEFGTITVVETGEGALSTDGENYLKRSASDPSYYGDAGHNYYTTVLPKEDGTVLEMCVDYTLVSNDASGEEITVRAAKAFVPAVYTKWLPNYAYTYIFKISDNTNGWTNPNGSDPAGLFPITFDAVVLDPEETGTQNTITTVSTPSITTYQKGRLLTDEVYKDDRGDIYIIVQDASQKCDLNTKGKLYTIDASGASVAVSEATVMDALNIRVAGSAAVNGRNGLALSEGTATPVEKIAATDATDGNEVPITVKVVLSSGSAPADWGTNYFTDPACTSAAGAYADGTYYRKNSAVKFTPSEGTYAYVYEVSDDTDTYLYSAESNASKPSDWTTADTWYKDPDGASAVGDGDFVADKIFYKRYTDRNTTYVVKVINVVD